MSSTDGASRKVSELSRQFGRSEPSQTPTGVASPGNQSTSPTNQKKRILPKILSHVTKTNPVAVAVPDETSNRESLIPDQNMENGSDQTEHDDITDTIIINDDVKTIELETEEKKSIPVATSVSLSRPLTRPPPTMPSQSDQSNLVGLDQLQEQVRRLALRRGFTLNVLVVGIKNLVIIIMCTK